MTDHHAIIPTMQSLHFNTGTLQNQKKKCLNLLRLNFCRKIRKPVTENTKVTVEVEGHKFIATGMVVANPGYTKYLYIICKEEGR